MQGSNCIDNSRGLAALVAFNMVWARQLPVVTNAWLGQSKYAVTTILWKSFLRLGAACRLAAKPAW
jgi:hypothetical protein